MGSQIEPYGTTNTDEDGNSTMTLEGYYIHSVPVLGYDYCTNEDLVQEAINGLNYRKSYIDYVVDFVTKNDMLNEDGLIICEYEFE